MNKIIGRILFSLLLLFALVMLPWWLFFLIGVGGIFLFSYYFEFVVLALLFDLLYGPGAVITLFGSRSMLLSFILTLAALLAILIIERLKKNLMIYNA